MMFGNREQFGLSLLWSGVESGSAAEVTRGVVVLWVGGNPIWGSAEEGLAEADGIEWTWVELLEFLVEAWSHLEWEQAYPAPLNPLSPMDLEREVERIRADESPEYADEVHEEMLSFLEVHDLANALQGAYAAPVRILRQGNLSIVSTGQVDLLLPYSDVRRTLEEVGEEVATRVALSCDERARISQERWKARDRAVDATFVLRYGAGLDASTSALVEPYLKACDGRYTEDEILVAARMTAGLVDDENLRRLLDEIKKIEKRETPSLDALVSKVKGLTTRNMRAWEEGYALAQAVRPLLPDTRAEGRVEIEQVLGELGALILEVGLGVDDIDAVAVFGGNHGPAILVNTDGHHAQGGMGRRATLAHELCHLVWDREGALPFAEALSPRAPELPEKRARAFAAELLMPQDEAVERARTRKLSSFEECRKLVDELGEEYGASQELVAWQLKNGQWHRGKALPRMVERWIEQLASPRR